MTTARTARFNVGTTFLSSGKRKDTCTVTDILRTYNSAGDLVNLRYVATHPFMGQLVTDYDVVETTIARNLLAAA
jgi:hypothetical protein